MAERTILSPYGYREVVTPDFGDRARVLDLVRHLIRRRDLAVARVLAHLSLLPRNAKGHGLGPRPTLGVGPPIVQDRLPLAGSGMEALHCVPGQLWVGGSLPWDLVADDQILGLTDLHHCFARTDNLPAPFLRVENLPGRAESRFLGAFALAAARTWARAAGSDSVGIANLHTGWEEWLRESERVHRDLQGSLDRGVGAEGDRGEDESAIIAAHHALAAERRSLAADLLRQSAEEVFQLLL